MGRNKEKERHNMGSVGNTKTGSSIMSNADNGFRTDRTLVSKGQADMFTKDYTPQMFLGDIDNEYMGTLNSLKTAAEENAPKTLNIGGYTFENMGNPHTDWQQTGRNTGKDIVMIDYQSTEQVGKEYPILQIGIRVWRTPKGKVKSEIIRDGYINKTRFW